MRYLVGCSITPGPQGKHYAVIDKENGVVSWHETREEAEKAAQELLRASSKVMMKDWPCSMN